MTVSSSIIVHLRDGKTQMRCVEIKGNSTEEFLDIFNKICEKAPADCLKGYTKENLQEFRQYKKRWKSGQFSQSVCQTRHEIAKTEAVQNLQQLPV